MRRFLAVVLLFALGWSQPGGAEDYSSATTIAVMPFTKLEGGKTVWLDKAIGDLVAQKLMESGNYAVLNRDALQTFLKEMQFQQSGFVDEKQDVPRIGRLAKVDEVIYGSYALDGGTLTIHASLMRVDTQNVAKRQDVKGSLNDLISLSQQIVQQLLAAQNIPLSDDERTALDFRPTDSLTAIEHFFNGMQSYDDGDYETALGQFLAATQQDEHYLDAKLWFARMLEQLGKADQAIVAYLELYDFAPDSTEGQDARYFAGRLQEDALPQEAIKTYQKLADISPETPQALEALFRQAELYQRIGDNENAYARYKHIDDFSDNVRKHAIAYEQKWQQEQVSRSRSLTSTIMSFFTSEPQSEEDRKKHVVVLYKAVAANQSRFLSWQHALGLYRKASIAMVEIYRDLPPLKNGERREPPRGSFAIDPANPIISGDFKKKDLSLFAGDHTTGWGWNEIFYALIVPKGYTAVGAKLQIKGRLFKPDPMREYALRVMPFPLPENYQNTWLGTVYGQTAATTTLDKNVSFFGRDQTIVAVQLFENQSEIDAWKVELVLRPESKKTVPPLAPSNVEGALLAKVHLGPTRHVMQSLPQFIMMTQPKQKLAIADNFNDGLWLIGVKGDLYGEETDLWSTYSADGGHHWSEAQPMPVNSASLEFFPTLVRAEDGSLQLFFLSNRRGFGWEIWTSTQDRKNKRWSSPRLIPVDKFAPGGFADPILLNAQVRPYAVMQDAQGHWLLATYSHLSKKTSLLVSDDLETWKLLTSLDLGEIHTIGLGQDKTGTYYLASAIQNGDPFIRVSNDAIRWDDLGEGTPSSLPSIATPYQMNLLPNLDGGVTVLFSDPYIGLQHMKAGRQIEQLESDLVTNAALEPYAVASTTGDAAIAALWKDDDIYIQHYRRFAFADNAKNDPEEMVYTERSRDAENGIWDRAIARARYIQPDVTAVGTSPGGRVWWGIESGVMSQGADGVFQTDVSRGFFTHYVDGIKQCGDFIWFTSSALDEPRVGYSSGHPSALSANKSLRLNELHGTITAAACGQAGVYFATSTGEVLDFSSEGKRQRFALDDHANNETFTALAYDARAGALLAATKKGALFKVKNGRFTRLFTLAGHKAGALAVDQQGHIWAAFDGAGIRVLDSQGKILKTFPSQALAGANIGKMIANPKGGIWAMADRYSDSQGLMRLDLKSVSFRNPPQKVLKDIIDFDVSDNGTLWIGTNADGLYHYAENP